jgi:hypothetical protein
MPREGGASSNRRYQSKVADGAAYWIIRPSAQLRTRRMMTPCLWLIAPQFDPNLNLPSSSR